MLRAMITYCHDDQLLLQQQ